MSDSARGYLDSVVACYIENWPDAFRRLSIANSGTPLTGAQVNALLVANGGTCANLVRSRTHNEDMHSLECWLDTTLSKYPLGGFVRLGSRSPKDSMAALGRPDGFRVTNGRDALAILTGQSERVQQDLLLAREAGYTPWLWVRAWQHNLEPWHEWRCFMDRGVLRGVSQYAHFDHFEKEIEEYLDTITWGVRNFSAQYFRPSVPPTLPQIVFDVIVQIRESAANGIVYASREITVKLLEVNPWSPYTDPCLFDWNKPGDMGGQLRYLKGTEVKDVPLG